MKIEWLDDDMTIARLTKGWLWWKRVAEVRRAPDSDACLAYDRWRFVPSERTLPDSIRWELEGARALELSRRKDDSDWRLAVTLPVARTVKP